MVILKFFKHPALKPSRLKCKLDRLVRISDSVVDVDAEFCYYVESRNPLSKDQVATLKWILTAPFGDPELNDDSALQQKKDKSVVVEIGPR